MFEHPFDFDPTCGYSLEELQAVTPPATEPADFVSFWRKTREEADDISLEATMRPLWSPRPEWAVSEVYFNSLAGVRIGAWLVRPERSRGGLVVGHGYGSRLWFDTFWAEEGLTCIFPCIRGFGLSACADIPWHPHRHVLHGIASREDYVLRGAAADLWQAASALLEIYPDTAGNLCYSGASFGGGMGALMLPWDDRFRAAHLDVPTFGHHPLRLCYPSTGSAEAVRLYYVEHPEIARTLAYYDAATAASHIDIPVLCSEALFDPAVIPPGQFAVANALNSRSERFFLSAGHFKVAETDEERQRLYVKAKNLYLQRK